MVVVPTIRAVAKRSVVCKISYVAQLVRNLSAVPKIPYAVRELTRAGAAPEVPRAFWSAEIVCNLIAYIPDERLKIDDIARLRQMNSRQAATGARLVFRRFRSRK